MAVRVPGSAQSRCLLAVAGLELDAIAVLPVLFALLLGAPSPLAWLLGAFWLFKLVRTSPGLARLGRVITLEARPLGSVLVLFLTILFFGAVALHLAERHVQPQAFGSLPSALWWAVGIGVACSVGGVVVSYYAETPSGGTIVLLAVAAFLVASTGAALAARARRAAHARSERHDHEHGPDCGDPTVEHGDHVDYLHDGHRHAAHEEHYDEHGQHAEVESR